MPGRCRTRHRPSDSPGRRLGTSPRSTQAVKQPTRVGTPASDTSRECERSRRSRRRPPTRAARPYIGCGRRRRCRPSSTRTRSSAASRLATLFLPWWWPGRWSPGQWPTTRQSRRGRVPVCCSKNLGPRAGVGEPRHHGDEGVVEGDLRRGTQGRDRLRDDGRRLWCRVAGRSSFRRAGVATGEAFACWGSGPGRVCGNGSAGTVSSTLPPRGWAVADRMLTQRAVEVPPRPGS